MTIEVRPIDPSDDRAITLVATRMRQTLVEVLGEEEGGQMYTMDWLVDRVRFHLDPEQCTGEVFLAVDDEAGDGEPIVGHTIVRIHNPEMAHGIFSTTYVTPEARRGGVANLLLDQGEQWMRKHDLAQAMTHTDPHNHKLIELYTTRGYDLRRISDEFVRLTRDL